MAYAVTSAHGGEHGRHIGRKFKLIELHNQAVWKHEKCEYGVDSLSHPSPLRSYLETADAKVESKLSHACEAAKEARFTSS